MEGGGKRYVKHVLCPSLAGVATAHGQAYYGFRTYPTSSQVHSHSHVLVSSSLVTSLRTQAAVPYVRYFVCHRDVATAQALWTRPYTQSESPPRARRSRPHAHAARAQHVGRAAPPPLLHGRGGRHPVHHPQALPESEAHRLGRAGHRLVSAACFILLPLSFVVHVNAQLQVRFQFELLRVQRNCLVFYLLESRVWDLILAHAI